ncbi:hypothetical protein [Rhizobium leguminosarum]|uniref:hypothetical protein n=1 Tax=Rhizobium leguminosarum TaxID=384 RepID=UPI0010322B9D|nr:hypothetical protein [Rhizobium leguminosarum]TBF89166.1 hypothetical protein ELG82_37105 [Rhizobium leguminosarum]
MAMRAARQWQTTLDDKMASNTFRIIADLDTFDAEMDNEHYKDWFDDMDREKVIELPRGSFNMTDIEMRWVILDAVEREIAEEAQLGGPDEFVEDHNIISALSDNGFCPAFIEDIRELCNAAMKRVISG